MGLGKETEFVKLKLCIISIFFGRMRVCVRVRACVRVRVCVCACVCVCAFMLYALNFDNIYICKEPVSA